MIHVHRMKDPPDREVVGIFYNSQLLVEVEVEIFALGSAEVKIRDGLGAEVASFGDYIEEVL